MPLSRRPGPAARAPRTVLPAPLEALLVTSDAALGARLSRWARDAGGSATVHPSPQAAGAAWHRAPLVLLGADAAPLVPPEVPPPGGDLVLVADRDGDLPVDLPADLPPEVAAGRPVHPVPGADETGTGSQLWRQALRVGAAEVAVLPEAGPWLLRRLEAALLPAPTAPVLGVTGGRGGAGASTLAAALAVCAAAAGLRVLLLDVDPLGGGIDLVLGAEAEPGLRWPELATLPGRLPHGSLSAALPSTCGVSYLTWDRDLPAVAPAEQVGAAVDAARREADLVVLDLPRTAAGPALAAAERAERLLLVVPAEVRAAAAARRVASGFEPAVADIGLVVRGPAPTGLPAEAVADCLALPLLGELRPEPGLAAALDRGDGPAWRSRGPLSELSRRLVAEALQP